MNEYFNSNGWTCHQCQYDPCLFYIARYPTGVSEEDVTEANRPYKEEAWVLVHTDDCDGYGTSNNILDAIFKATNEKWKAKEVDSSYMLGVKRILQVQNGVSRCELTMTPYVEGMTAAFADYLPKSDPSTPFKANLILCKQPKATNKEAEAVLERGYQRAIGMLLWAQRGVYPECAYGLNQLCTVMSSPTEEAWREAMNMIAWMRSQKARGILYTSEGNRQPIIFSDAAFNPDPADGLSQFGYCLQYMGASIATCSKKLAHVGLSSFHNEYMGLRHAAAEVVWMRQLMQEIGMGFRVKEPTIVYGDNEAANKLTKEDFISTGNKYIYQPYHWIKELERIHEIDVRYKRTDLNLADVFTKPVSRQTVANPVPKLTGYEPWE